jgi:hypothetical protein
VHLIEAPVRVMTATCGAHIRVPALLYTSLQHLGRRLATERRLCPIPKPWRTLAAESRSHEGALQHKLQFTSPVHTQPHDNSIAPRAWPGSASGPQYPSAAGSEGAGVSGRSRPGVTRTVVLQRAAAVRVASLRPARGTADVAAGEHEQEVAALPRGEDAIALLLEPALV